jgi:hypothetical protein
MADPTLELRSSEATLNSYSCLRSLDLNAGVQQPGVAPHLHGLGCFEFFISWAGPAGSPFRDACTSI